jgi:hypothetical protein
MVEQNPQLFILADEIWSNTSIPEIEATVSDMREMDIFYPPCDEFQILVSAEITVHVCTKEFDDKFTEQQMDYYRNNCLLVDVKIFNMKDWENNCNCELSYPKKNGEWVGAFWENNKLILENKITKEKYDETKEAIEDTIIYILELLIVSLATRNIERKNKANRMAKQAIGIGKLKKNYEHVTTITIGKVDGAERNEGIAGGWTVRPHLRRGHVREQKFGPNNQYSKKVFIQPVFVNAAEGFVNTRKAYNVKVA